MVTCNANLVTLAEQGQQNTVIAWSYIDDSSGSLIDPTALDGELYDPSDVQRDPDDTSNTIATPFTPTKDTDGSVTGTTGKYYVLVDFDVAAETGVWYVTTTFTHESVQRTHNICFNVIEAGASVGGDGTDRTTYRYCTPGDIAAFLLREGIFGVNDTPSKSMSERGIMMAEAEVDSITGHSWRPNTAVETHDIISTESRYQDSQFGGRLPRRVVKLNHRDVHYLDSSRGHKIEVYDGSDSGTGNRDWTDWLATKTEGRSKDWWMDYEQGILHLRMSFLERRHARVRVTYEWGGVHTQITTGISSSGSTVPSSDASRFPLRGLIRIGDEYLDYRGRTDTSFTAALRGVMDSTAASHSNGAEATHVPLDIMEATIRLAAANYVDNADWTTHVVDGGSITQDYGSRARRWREIAEERLSSRRGEWFVD